MTNGRILGCLLTLLSFCDSRTVASAPHGKPFPGGTLHLKVQILSQKYCMFGTERSPTLRFILSFRFENISDTPVTFNHVNADDTIYIGKSLKEIQVGKFERGSRVPETLGLSSSKRWAADGRIVAPGEVLEIKNANVWVDLAGHGQEVDFGASPGKHFLKVAGEAEISNDLHGPSTVFLSSEPAPFVIDAKPELKACD